MSANFFVQSLTNGIDARRFVRCSCDLSVGRYSVLSLPPLCGWLFTLFVLTQLHFQYSASHHSVACEVCDAVPENFSTNHFTTLRRPRLSTLNTASSQYALFIAKTSWYIDAHKGAQDLSLLRSFSYVKPQTDRCRVFYYATVGVKK